jgi:hypothetical protein
MSSPADWSDNAFACGGFSMADPQYFQYQWVKHNETTGEVTAKADLDGDGGFDVSLSVPISCTAASSCTAGAMTETY